MKLNKIFILIAAIFLTFSWRAAAQTNVVTVTNIVILTVTNFVIVTNPPIKTEMVKAAAAAAAAQPPPAPKYPWRSSVTAGVTLTRGNSDSLLATAKFLTGKKNPINEFNFGADATYGSSGGVANNETYHGFGQWNHLFTDRWYSFLRGEGLHDGIANVKYRATITSGAGYYLIKKPDTTFVAAEAGPGVVLQRVGDSESDYATMRLAERFEHKFKKNSARVWQNMEFLPQIDKPSDYLINAEIGIESALFKQLSLSICLDDNFNSQPADGHKRNDVKLVSGVTYKF